MGISSMTVRDDSKESERRSTNPHENTHIRHTTFFSDPAVPRAPTSRYPPSSARCTDSKHANPNAGSDNPRLPQPTTNLGIPFLDVAVVVPRVCRSHVNQHPRELVLIVSVRIHLLLLLFFLLLLAAAASVYSVVVVSVAVAPARATQRFPTAPFSFLLLPLLLLPCETFLGVRPHVQLHRKLAFVVHLHLGCRRGDRTCVAMPCGAVSRAPREKKKEKKKWVARFDSTFSCPARHTFGHLLSVLCSEHDNNDWELLSSAPFFSFSMHRTGTSRYISGTLQSHKHPEL